MKANHPPVYYDIRTAVRFAFWSSLAIGLVITLTSHLGDHRPSCDIQVVSASPPMWESRDGAPIDVSKCVAPAYMVLNQDGSWQWVEDK